MLPGVEMPASRVNPSSKGSGNSGFDSIKVNIRHPDRTNLQGEAHVGGSEVRRIDRQP